MELSATVNISKIQNEHNPKPAPPTNGSDVFDWEQFDKKLKRVRTIALITNMVYTLNWFLGFCAVTWATTIILGGMISDLKQRDFYSVSVLLLLEAMRLAASRFVGFFMTQHIIFNDPDPSFFVYSWTYVVVGEVCHQVGQVMNLVILGVSIVLPARRLRDLDYDLNPDSPGHFNRTLISLQIFYSVVFVNAVIGAINATSSITIVYILTGFKLKDYFLRRYYHKIVWNGIENGMLYSMQDLDVLNFALVLQAEEYKQRKRANKVKDMYSVSMKYLYEHPRQKGFEVAAVSLESEDIFLREAAANVVGLWINLAKDQGKTLMLQKALLSKLADALEHQGTGKAAASSFEQMAQKFPEQTVAVRNSGNRWLVDILMERIHEVVLQGMHDKALRFLKVVAVLVKKGVFSAKKDIRTFSDVKSWDDLFRTLRSDLLQIACDEGAKKRTLVIAAYSLFKLSQDLKPEELCNVKDALVREPVAKDEKDKDSQHMLQDEKDDYLTDVVGELNDRNLLDVIDHGVQSEFIANEILEQCWRSKVKIDDKTNSAQHWCQWKFPRRLPPLESGAMKILSYLGALVILLVMLSLSLFLILENRVTF